MFQTKHCAERVVFLEPLSVCAVRGSHIIICVAHFPIANFGSILVGFVMKFKSCKQEMKNVCDRSSLSMLFRRMSQQKSACTHIHIHTQSASIHYKRSECTGSSKEWPIRICSNNLEDSNVRLLKIGGHVSNFTWGPQIMYFNWTDR